MLFLPINSLQIFIWLIFLLASFSVENIHAQHPFAPGSIWEFNENQVTLGGPLEGYTRITATDRDTLVQEQIWQVLEFYSLLKEYQSLEIDTTETTLLVRRDGNQLLSLQYGSKYYEYNYYLLDGKVGDVLQFQFNGGGFPDCDSIVVIGVDTILFMDQPVQQLTLIELGDTIQFMPLTGKINRPEPWSEDLHFLRHFNLHIDDLCAITDYLTHKLACFTFPNGVKYSSGNCGNFTTSISNNNLEADLNLFPNPTSGTLHIVGIESGEITVFDYQGRMIMASPFTGENLDLSHLLPGMYFLRFEENNRMLMKKVIKL